MSCFLFAAILKTDKDGKQYIEYQQKYVYLSSEPYRYSCQPFSKRQNLDSSKLKQFAEGNFEIDKNGRKFFRWVENTVGKR